MGAYLDAPKTTKSTRYSNNESMEFAVSEMQGWRLSMEDADIAYLDID
jgi:hypothetical protein